MMPQYDGAAMPPPSRRAPVNYARLSAYLEALHYPLRLQLLDLLRFPRTLSEIRVSPRRLGRQNPDRAAARETVRFHLDKLVEAGLVEVETAEGDGHKVNRYWVNAPKLYELTEELRRLSTMYAGGASSAAATGTLSSEAGEASLEGPRLTLVHGVYEGKAFPLTQANATDGRWVIGRKRGLAVSLDYDPFVSVENSVVAEHEGRYTVTDLPSSKNGTAVNWGPLRKGGSRGLRAGDLIGVGRSLLQFLPE